MRTRIELDLRDPHGLVKALRTAADRIGPTWDVTYPKLSALADLIEAQTRPPKPPEPQGIGAVVESTPMCVDEDGDTTTILIRHEDGLWYSQSHGGWYWRDVQAVRVLSEGVTP